MKKEATELTPLKQAELSKTELFLKSFKELSRSRRDLFILFAIGLVQNTGINMMTSSLTIYFTSIKHLSDFAAGCVAASFGLCSFLYSLYLGSFIDIYGLRLCLLTGSASAVCGYIILLSISNTLVQIISILTLLATANALIIPSLKLGIKHYTVDEAKSLGYSFLFIILFAGGAFAGILIDTTLTILGRNATSFSYMFGIGLVLMLSALTLAYFVKDVEKPNIELHTWALTREVIKTRLFWRFMVLTFFMVVTKSLYVHLSVTLPIYMSRELGPGAHFGYMLALHKGIMVVCIPLLTSLVYYFNSYSLLIMGTFLSAISVLPLLFSSNYLGIMLFIAIVSIGESLYAPRLIDYTLSIAPKGKEGTFVALASSPLMLGIIIAGLMGGGLLTEFCPSEGERHCWAMWGTIGLTSLMVPIIMLVCRSCLEEKVGEIEEMAEKTKPGFDAV